MPLIKVSSEVYEMLRILKQFPSVSYNDVILDLIRKADPDLIENWAEIMDERNDLRADGIEVYGRKNEWRLKKK